MRSNRLRRGRLTFRRDISTDGDGIMKPPRIFPRLCSHLVEDRKLMTNAFHLFISSLILSGSSFVFWIVCAKYYSTEDVGLAAMVFSLATLLASLSLAGMNFGTIRVLQNIKNKVEFIDTSLTLVGTLAIMVSIAFIGSQWLLSGSVAEALREPRSQLIFAGITVFMGMSLIVDAVFQSLESSYNIAIKNFVAGTSRLVCLPLLFAFGLLGIMSSWLAGILLSLVLSLSILLPNQVRNYRYRLRVNLGLIRGIIRYSFGNYAAWLISVAPSMTIPLIAGYVTGTESAAYAYVSFSVVTLLFSVPTAIGAALFAAGSSRFDKIANLTKNSVNASLLITGILSILMLVCSRFVLSVFGSQYADQSTEFLQILALSGIPFALNSVYVSKLRISESVRKTVGVVSVSTSVTVVSAVALSLLMGFNGIAIGWLAGQCTLSALALIDRKHGVLPYSTI